jgi:hypothetical protein
MATHPGGNEGFRILDELVCQAIPDAAVSGPPEASAPPGRGANSGMQVWEEVALDSAGPSRLPPTGVAEGSPDVGDRSAVGTHMVEVVIDRDFASYTEAEQERLLSAIKHLLVVAGDVRVVRRASRAMHA